MYIRLDNNTISDWIAFNVFEECTIKFIQCDKFAAALVSVSNVQLSDDGQVMHQQTHSTAWFRSMSHSSFFVSMLWSEANERWNFLKMTQNVRLICTHKMVMWCVVLYYFIIFTVQTGDSCIDLIRNFCDATWISVVIGIVVAAFDLATV